MVRVHTIPMLHLRVALARVRCCDFARMCFGALWCPHGGLV
ncbi:hypothetical protein HMPREF9248_0512 [Fannyhessea vaginae PB189-T1-4]|uniref:Uncharacterized protein n=1 Tax=Fannyhessea vaginae PB189-T1-4 TaxID=866774 RepID=A0ABN0AZA5_9ACTN|nr:hypothetical protein HMPREF9248_0512 [Fannyhessea vaginae PB189-T1-4]